LPKKVGGHDYPRTFSLAPRKMMEKSSPMGKEIPSLKLHPGRLTAGTEFPGGLVQIIFLSFHG